MEYKNVDMFNRKITAELSVLKSTDTELKGVIDRYVINKDWDLDRIVFEKVYYCPFSRYELIYRYNTPDGLSIRITIWGGYSDGESTLYINLSQGDAVTNTNVNFKSQNQLTAYLSNLDLRTILNEGVERDLENRSKFQIEYSGKDSDE